MAAAHPQLPLALPQHDPGHDVHLVMFLHHPAVWLAQVPAHDGPGLYCQPLLEMRFVLYQLPFLPPRCRPLHLPRVPQRPVGWGVLAVQCCQGQVGQVLGSPKMQALRGMQAEGRPADTNRHRRPMHHVHMYG